MRQMVAFLMVLLCLSPVGWAQSHLAMLPLAEGFEAVGVIFNDEGELVVPPGEFPQLAVVDGKNGWFVASKADQYYSDEFMLMNAEGHAVTDAVYSRHMYAAYADRIIFHWDVSGVLQRFFGTESLYGVLDGEGNVLVSALYKCLIPDGEGGFYAQPFFGDQLCKIDHEGNLTLTELYMEEINFFASDPYGEPVRLLAVREAPEGPLGFINADLQWVAKPQFAKALPFTGQYAHVYNEEGHCGLMDESGQIAVPMKYEDINQGKSIVAFYADSNRCDVYSSEGELLFSGDFRVNYDCGSSYWIAQRPAEEESSDWVVLDASGNILRSVDSSVGRYTVSTANGAILYRDEVTGLEHFTDAQFHPIGEGYGRLSGCGEFGGRQIFLAGIGDAEDRSSHRYGLIDGAGNVIAPMEYLSYIEVKDERRQVSHILFKTETEYVVVKIDGTELLRFPSP